MKRRTIVAVKVVAPGERSGLWAYFDEDGRLTDQKGRLRVKNGRPGQWKGRLGLDLLEAVANARANGAKDTAAAIEILRRKQKHRDVSLILRGGHWPAYKARYLEKVYVEAKKFWRPYFDQHLLGDQDKSFWFPDTKTTKKNRRCS